MSGGAQIVVLATLDTKGAEAAHLVGLIARHGHSPCLMDVGFRDAPSCRPDVERARVAAAADLDVAAVGRMRREDAVRAMGEGAGRLLAKGVADARYSGVIALGGNQGTAIAGIAFQHLPLGFPKAAVSTVASGNLRPYFGHKDVAVFFSVADLLGGPNFVSHAILQTAAAAISGMVAARSPFAAGPVPAIAVTAFGNTQPAVGRVHALLRERGFQPVPFHASGAGGSAMEELIDAGLFAGVVDLTTHELVGEVFGQDIYAPTRPGRLTAAARRGLPQVVAPGALDYFCFGATDTIPAACRDRPIHRHNPYNTNVRTSGAELRRLGEVLAERLNAAPRGTAAFLYPQKGWSEIGSSGGPLHDPAANLELLQSLRAHLSPAVEVHVLDLAINDPGFAERAVDVLEHLQTKEKSWPTRSRPQTRW